MDPAGRFLGGRGLVARPQPDRSVTAGLGVGALGLIAADLYVVGVLILFVGGIGLAVVAGDRLMRYAHNRRPPA